MLAHIPRIIVAPLCFVAKATGDWLKINRQYKKTIKYWENNKLLETEGTRKVQTKGRRLCILEVIDLNLLGT